MFAKLNCNFAIEIEIPVSMYDFAAVLEINIHSIFVCFAF